MAKGAKPFKYRNKWRATVTLANGTRPTKDFDKHSDAVTWIGAQRTVTDTEHSPELGGPTVATVAEALHLYAGLYTINKGGAKSELNRINHYLEGAGMAPLKLVESDDSTCKIIEYRRGDLPKAWQEHNEKRRELRSQTYLRIATIAKKRCNAVSTADLRRLVSDMKSEGLGDSTVQKEVALLKHMFNMAAQEWSWKGFENPCRGIKLGKSQTRFVFITDEERARLWQALGQCDNPYFWPLVEVELQTTLRRASLLAMQWDKLDLEGRICVVQTKTGQVAVPLTKHAVQVLSALPRHESGRVFPMTPNAVDCAWDGVRIKANLPALQFRDLRHIAATDFARRGFSSHQLKKVLGHKTTTMAEVYVNLVNQDVLDIMDRTEGMAMVMQMPPLAAGSGLDMLSRKRSERLTKSIAERFGDKKGWVDG